MNKKGFVSTSIVLALFLLFLFLLFNFLALYSANRRMLNRQKEDIKNSLIYKKEDNNYLLVNDHLFKVLDFDSNTVTAMCLDSINSADFEQWYNENIGYANGYITNDKGLIITLKNVRLLGVGCIADPYHIEVIQNEAE